MGNCCNLHLLIHPIGSPWYGSETQLCMDRLVGVCFENWSEITDNSVLVDAANKAILDEIDASM